jgi:aminopeptidase N
VHSRRLAALATAVALAVVSLTSAQSASGRQAEPHGAPGIGDAYFPLDGNGGIDVLSYDVHDRYRFAVGRLSGWTKVRLRATETLSGFDLDFLLPVGAVRMDGARADFEKSGHELVVNEPVTAGQKVDLRIRYAGHPSAYSYTDESNWLANDHEVVAMNQPHMAPWWFPSNDHPRDRARMRISITVPKADKVIANGRLVSRTVDGALATTTWRADEPMVPYLAFFAAGPFEVARGRVDGRPWYAAVSGLLPDSEQRVAMGLMERTPRLLRWLEKRLGDYPFSVTGGLTTGLPVGFALENQTRPTYPYLGDGPGAVSTVVHELAHQWFGDSVSLQDWKHIWLNEGAATFMEVYYDERHGGETGAHWLHRVYGELDADDDFWQHRIADPCPDHQSCVNSIFARWVYSRGGMTLQALRNVIGEGDYWTLLRRWVSERAGTTGSTEQFQALAEQVSDRDLDGFFDAWLHTPEKPADTPANGLG